MATKIKLMRLGKIRSPQYRIVVADSRTKRDGKYIECIGQYRPKEEPSFINVDSERAQYWLSVGAQPTDPVRVLLELTGDWQRFKGKDSTESRVKVAQARVTRLSRAQEAAVRVVELKAVEEKAKAEKEKKKAKKSSESEAGEKTSAKASKGKASKENASQPDAPKAAATEATSDAAGQA